MRIIEFADEASFLPYFRHLKLVDFFHLRAEAAEDDLLDIPCGIFANCFHGNLGRLFPGVAINAGGDCGEGDSFTVVFFGKSEAVLVARLQKFGFTMQAITINRTRGMDYKLRRELKPGLI